MYQHTRNSFSKKIFLVCKSLYSTRVRIPAPVEFRTLAPDFIIVSEQAVNNRTPCWSVRFAVAETGNMNHQDTREDTSAHPSQGFSCSSVHSHNFFANSASLVVAFPFPNSPTGS